MNNQNVITREGLKDLEDELSLRINETRKKIADEISKAREQGDLSENASYTSALESKQFNEARISELEELIKNSVVKEINTKDKYVGLGEKVTIERLSDKKIMEFTLVGENEANPTEGKLSIKSPIGSAVNGSSVGIEFEVPLPSGIEKFKVVKIN